MQLNIFTVLFVFFSLLTHACAANPVDPLIDVRSENKLAALFAHPQLTEQQLSRPEKRAKISALFLTTPYQADTLETSPDRLVINLMGVDCFTFIDYVEALSFSHDRASFIKNLIHVRYKNDRISYLNRRHFFTDWLSRRPQQIIDMTEKISPDARVTVKLINQKADDSQFIPGLPGVTRRVAYIPGHKIDRAVIDQLKNGDYIGIYATVAGLDVTHVGIFVMTTAGPMFRNASSLTANRRVVDSPFLEYVRAKPGIIVLRSQ